MPVMNDEVPGEGDFDAGRRSGEFDDITWRILAVVATPGVFGVVSPDVFLGGRTGPAVALLAAVPSSGPPGVVPLLLTCCHRPSL